MLSDPETLSFNSLWIAHLICSEITVKKILNRWFADVLLLMLLNSVYFSSEKNFSVSICVLITLSLLKMLWSVLCKSKMWNDVCNLSVQSLLHHNNLHNSFLYKLSKTEVDCSMNLLQFVHSMQCSFFLSNFWNNW